MKIGDRENEAELMSLLPSIRSNRNEWIVLRVVMMKSCETPKEEVVNKILQLYRNYEGVIYTDNENKIICLVRMGMIQNYMRIKTDLEEKLPRNSCRVMARPMTSSGLKQIQIDLMNKDDSTMSMFSERERRKGNVLMIADDDAFVRKAVKQILAFFGEVVEAENGDGVVGTYMNNNPDVILLDIHMPGKNGLELIDTIMQMDPDAYIIILSGDSVKENVLEAIDKGAVGFLTKPPKREKVIEYLNQCITIV
ncbi:MAG: response regulator [Alphaproteobacteria bacterium]|nr:response regulator [Alphaproteobacteria bacterium]